MTITRVSDLPAALVEDLALGLHEPAKVASWHGISDDEWKQLQVWPLLIRAVEAKRAEFDREGMSRRMKLAMQFDAVGDRLFQQMMAEEATPRMRLDYLQMAAEVADLKPKKEVAQQGSGFSVVINLGDPGKPAVTIEHTPVVESDPLGTPPPYLKRVPAAVLDVPAYA